MSENKPTPESTCPAALPFMITDQEMKDLMRFHECVTDGEGYDVPKERMKQLAEIGLLRRATSSFYEHTTFGLSVINGDFQSADEIRKQRDDLQTKANAMAETINAIAALCTYQHESKEDFIGRVRAVLGDDPDLRVSSVRKERDELRSSLIKYGLHKLSCDYVENHEGGIFGKSTGTCDCGFAEAVDRAKGDQPDNPRGFSLWLDREAWGHIVDGLILERERSIQRKQANPESNSNNIADRCAELIDKIAKAAEIKSAKGGAA